MPKRITDEECLAAHSRRLPNGCIEWTGSKDRDGYGKVNRISARFGRVSLPHRLAYLLDRGSIPDGCEIDHKCKSRACVNPGHLEAVPHTVNIERGDYRTGNHRNTRKTHCKYGHPFNEGNVRIEVWRGITMRKCVICTRAKNARSNAKRKQRRAKLGA